MSKHELSIFIDESGNFGPYQKTCPFYIVVLLFHDQTKEIGTYITDLNNAISYLNLPNNCIHAGPIIRHEGEYKSVKIENRRKALSIVSNFVRKAPINYCVFVVNRVDAIEKDSITKKLSLSIGKFFIDNQQFFTHYKNIKIYYDNGQKGLKNIISDVLPKKLSSEVIFKRNVSTRKYRLLQIADVICTFELINRKIEINKMSKSELMFFKNDSTFKSNFYRKIDKKRIDK